MISGAIAFYETDGDNILKILRDSAKPGLITGMETIGASLYWLRRQMEAFVREADKNEKA
jgi:hypothetical protein